MSKHYYITDHTQPRGFSELTETEWKSFIGVDEIRPYVAKVYRGKITIDEVPEEYRQEVETIVNNRIARFGEHQETISDTQALAEIVEVIQ